MNVGLVIPVYNEAPGLPEFHRRLRAAIDSQSHDFEIWYINDGSSDDTTSVVKDIIRQDNRVRLLNLSRNFGHQAALTAGLDFAQGEVVICMDGDGQHSPKYIADMLDLAQRGFEIVLTQRTAERKTGVLKGLTSRLFYRLINLLSDTTVTPGGADFRLMSRQVVLSLRRLRETHRFLRGLVNWMGFRTTVLQIEATHRIAGRSKYSPRKMLRLANEAIFSFSTLPIRLSILLGVFVLALAFIQFFDPLRLILTGRAEELVPGWTTLIISVLVLGATQLITLAIVGQYVGLIYEQVKGRPIYFVEGKPIDPHSVEREEPS